MSEHSYDAFISYRRSDGRAVARWLRRELEAFRVPKALRANFGRKLKIYLDTAYERGTSDFYQQSIKPALLSSRFLLVVATPDAIRRPGGAEDWIEREVSDFTGGPNANNVVAIRGAGKFDEQLPADLNRRFPNIEIVDLRGAGPLSFLNPVRAARLSAEKLKLIAPLLSIAHEDMPRLRQEEERRQQMRLGSTLGTVMGVLVAVSGLSVFALQSRHQALRALDDSMYAAGGMALAAARLDTRDANTNSVRRHVVNQGCDLLDKFRLGAGSDPQVAEIVMCRLERARERERLREHDMVRQQFADAIEFATRRHQQLGRVDAVLGLVQARQALAEYFLRQKDAANAEAEFTRLLEDSRRLAKIHEGISELVEAQGEALGQLGDLYAARAERSKAVESYDTAATAVRELLELKAAAIERGRSPDPRLLAWFARLHRLSGQQHLELGDDDKALEKYRHALDTPSLAGSGQLPPQVEHEHAVTQALIFQLESKRRNVPAAERAKTEALMSIDRIARSKAPNDLRENAASLKKWIEAQNAN